MTDLATVDLIAEDLPDHAAQVAQYVSAGLDRRAAFDLEIAAARIISRGRRTFIETGRDLAQARETAQYGTWGPFLARCGIEERTAQNLMQVARTFGDKPEMISALPATALYALSAPGADPDVVDTITAEVEAGARPTVAEVKQRLAPPAPEPPAPTRVELPWDFVAWQRRAATLGADVTFDGREYRIGRAGQDPIQSAAWPSVTSWITEQERQATPPAPALPAQLPTPLAMPATPPADEGDEELAAAPAPQLLPLTPTPTPSLPPALGATVTGGIGVEARKLLVCKRALLTEALALIEAELARTPGVTVVVSQEAAELAARTFLQAPALGGAAAMLGFSARVEEAAA